MEAKLRLPERPGKSRRNIKHFVNVLAAAFSWPAKANAAKWELKILQFCFAIDLRLQGNHSLSNNQLHACTSRAKHTADQWRRYHLAHLTLPGMRLNHHCDGDEFA